MRGDRVPVNVATTVNLDGRRVAQNTTRHIVAANDFSNGTGQFDSTSLRTPARFSAPLTA